MHNDLTDRFQREPCQDVEASEGQDNGGNREYDRPKRSHPGTLINRCQRKPIEFLCNSIVGRRDSATHDLARAAPIATSVALRATRDARRTSILALTVSLLRYASH